MPRTPWLLLRQNHLWPGAGCTTNEHAWEAAELWTKRRLKRQTLRHIYFRTIKNQSTQNVKNKYNRRSASNDKRRGEANVAQY